MEFAQQSDKAVPAKARSHATAALVEKAARFAAPLAAVDAARLDAYRA